MIRLLIERIRFSSSIRWFNDSLEQNISKEQRKSRFSSHETIMWFKWNYIWCIHLWTNWFFYGTSTLRPFWSLKAAFNRKWNVRRKKVWSDIRVSKWWQIFLRGEVIIYIQEQDTHANVMVSNACPHIRGLCCPFPLAVLRFSFHH